MSEDRAAQIARQQEVGCSGRCPRLKETSSPTDMDGETYECDHCGQRYRLYYDDMQ